MDYLRSGVQDEPGQDSETLSLLKLQKISQAWWWVPIIPATRESEALHHGRTLGRHIPRFFFFIIIIKKKKGLILWLRLV